MLWPVSPETSSQLWVPRCGSRCAQARFALRTVFCMASSFHSLLIPQPPHSAASSSILSLLLLSFLSLFMPEPPQFSVFSSFLGLLLVPQPPRHSSVSSLFLSLLLIRQPPPHSSASSSLLSLLFIPQPLHSCAGMPRTRWSLARFAWDILGILGFHGQAARFGGCQPILREALGGAVADTNRFPANEGPVRACADGPRPP